MTANLLRYDRFTRVDQADLLGYDRYTYFYRSNSPFSNWHAARFTYGGVRFETSEQFMIFGKALLFGDLAAANNIMGSNNPRENKEVGRTIRGFIQETWKLSAREVVYAGNRAKFEQHAELLTLLLATQGTLLVEASPYDTCWGIGLSASDPLAKDPVTWRGTNWQGEVLTLVRDDIISGVEHKSTLVEGWFIT